MDKNQLTVAFEQNDISLNNRLEIIQDALRKSYLSRLTDMPIAPVAASLPWDKTDDWIENIRLYHIAEMVYSKDESTLDKFNTVFNSLSPFNASVFIIFDSDGKKTDFYVGIRNNEVDRNQKRSTVSIGDTLKNALISHFPGIKIQAENRFKIADLSNKISRRQSVASVSVKGKSRADKNHTNKQFSQGLEKLVMAMDGREYTGIIIAENQSPQLVQTIRNQYQQLYTKLSPYQKVQFSDGDTTGTSRAKSFFEMSGKQKAAMLGGALLSLAGAGAGALFAGLTASSAAASAVASAATAGLAVGGIAGAAGAGAGVAAGLNASSIGTIASGAMIGGQLAGPLTGFINSLAPNEQISESHSTNITYTTENKEITDLLKFIDEAIKRTHEFDSYGMWNVAGYFISDDMANAEIAASYYRSLMSGEDSGREVSAICAWNCNRYDGFRNLTEHLSCFIHPRFSYGESDSYRVYTDATTWISGKELSLHLGFPRATIAGMPVTEHPEFGKEVTTYQLFGKKDAAPEDRITLGRIFDLGQITNKLVELDNASLNMHTFVTGSTGSGKSNAVYQMLNELRQDGIPFLVIEPAKGEYKDVFGHLSDVNVFSTNPKIAQLINLNPFRFPDSIHVLEHVDGLVEIFSVCWPMYDAMSAFFKDAILKAYEAVGWDLGSSTFEGDGLEYPDFQVLEEQLGNLIDQSDYAPEVKSNYRGALLTRVKSLSVGLNRFIFTSNQTPYEELFDENCILDISRVKSNETKALLMGLMVYILNEYRTDRKTGNNNGLRHVTVLEEAHNLLKNTTGKDSELTGKSVEMLTQTIAEIRTYGEGFIIVDQSPSSVDISAIKNTNTKIVLRTPEASDRESVGRSIGLNPDQINEIAKLPSGVAVVYQNNWISPILTIIDRARIQEIPYFAENRSVIRPIKAARTNLIKMIMQPWLSGTQIPKEILLESLNVLNLPRHEMRELQQIIDDYSLFDGVIEWQESEFWRVQKLVCSILDITPKILEGIEDSNALKSYVYSKLRSLKDDDVMQICAVIVNVQGD